VSRKVWSFLFVSSIIVISFISFSCETSAPEIISSYWQINIVERKDLGRFEENLVFFLYATDEDGDDDLSSIFLMHDESEQYWSIDSDSWTVNSSDGEHWVGSSDIVMPDGSPIPRGDYRVVLYDGAGEKCETTINLDTVIIDPKKIEFPEIIGKDDIITVNSVLDNVMLLLYDRNRRFVDSAMVEFDKTPLLQFPRYRDLTNQSRNQLYLYVWDSENGYGIISGPKIGLYDEAKKEIK